MSGLFTIAGLAAIDAAERRTPTSQPSSTISSLKSTVKMLEENLAKSLMINEALWELLRDKAKLTDDDLNAKLYDIDMRDGVLDGKNQRSTAVECSQCKRKISHRHTACMYCGHIVDDSVFRMT